MNEIYNADFEVLKSNYVRISYETYVYNQFNGSHTLQERNNIYELMSLLIEIPPTYNHMFYQYLIERPDLPSVICCILFGALNKLKGCNLNKKYQILVHELKYSSKSFNMLKAICEICNIQLIERKSIFGNSKIKLTFPQNFREIIQTEFNKLSNREQVTDQCDEYNKFVDWWSNVNENDISDNEMLFGAYQIMWYYNEICNGGFDQYWEFVTNCRWDLKQMQYIFNKMLPRKHFLLFSEALKAHISGQDCEKLNACFDYKAFEKQILPQIAKMVIGTLEMQ